MGRDRAAYMREYRSRRTIEKVRAAESAPELIDVLTGRIAELEEEVHHLKEELAKRPVSSAGTAGWTTSYRRTEFRPVPKPSRRK